MYSGLMEWAFAYGIIVWVILAIVHIAFAVGILSDSDLPPRENGKVTYFVNIWIWALAVLIGGVVVAGIYWVIHHSTLNPNRSKE